MLNKLFSEGLVFIIIIYLEFFEGSWLYFVIFSPPPKKKEVQIHYVKFIFLLYNFSKISVYYKCWCFKI